MEPNLDSDIDYAPLSSRKSFTKRALSFEKGFYEDVMNVEAVRGTPYDISQPELDAFKSFRQPSNNNPYVSRKQATEEMVEHNKPGQLLPPEENADIERTSEVLT